MKASLALLAVFLSACSSGPGLASSTGGTGTSSGATSAAASTASSSGTSARTASTSSGTSTGSGASGSASAGTGSTTGLPPLPDGGCNPYDSSPDAGGVTCGDGGLVCAPGTLTCASLPPGCTDSQLNTPQDPCLPFGESCQPFIGGGGGSCGFTASNGVCDPAISYPCGFGSPYTCAASPYFQGVSQCLSACQTQDDCFDPTTVCETGPDGKRTCQLDYCGDLDHQPIPGSYFGACPVGDAGVGTCVPYPSSNGVFGLCYAAGDAPRGGLCSFDGGAAGRCPVGQFCLDLPPAYCATLGGAGTDGYPDGGPGCAQDDIVLPLQGVIFVQVDANLCLPACTPNDAGLSPNCAPGVQCLPVSCADPRTACF